QTLCPQSNPARKTSQTLGRRKQDSDTQTSPIIQIIDFKKVGCVRWQYLRRWKTKNWVVSQSDRNRLTRGKGALIVKF
ncbi:MAG: hypothetical protein WDZ48_05760, partial [Pirellulales bacterium]